jgi:hypothetical protein
MTDSRWTRGEIRVVALIAAVVFVGTVGGVSAFAASGRGAATHVKITHWLVGLDGYFTGNFFGAPQPGVHGVAPGKTFPHCAARSPTMLDASYAVGGARHVPVQAIWRRNGRVYDTFHVKDLSNPSGTTRIVAAEYAATQVLYGIHLSLDLLEPGSPLPEGKWSLTIKEFGRVIGSSTVTLTSKHC